jgi:HK97 family phage major capsid protein
MAAAAGGNVYSAKDEAKSVYGESHPVTKALLSSIGSRGGFIVAPDQANELIELLRPEVAVRAAGPRLMPMPRGTMMLPGQASAASAFYGSETGSIKASQPSLNQIVASYKKLSALVPVSNDLLRYADPAADSLVRDDLLEVMALREDLAFIFGDGMQDTPRGLISFANSHAAATGGTPGNWLATSPSTAASGGNFITSTASFTFSTIISELVGLANKLDTANVRRKRRAWLMHPRTKNALWMMQNSLGVAPFRDEIEAGRLLGYPYRTTTQIPANIWDSSGANADCSFVFLVEMSDALLLDSMSLELMVSKQASYTDGGGTTINAMQQDLTVIRAISEHDFQMRHNAAIAVLQFVRWAPTLN